MAGLVVSCVDGAWLCWNQAGTEASCLGGAVRTARFTPAAPLDSDGFYDVVLNPAGYLGLTDLAGNPPLRFSTGSFAIAP